MTEWGELDLEYCKSNIERNELRIKSLPKNEKSTVITSYYVNSYTTLHNISLNQSTYYITLDNRNNKYSNYKNKNYNLRNNNSTAMQ